LYNSTASATSVDYNQLLNVTTHLPEDVNWNGYNTEDTFCLGAACAENYLFTRLYEQDGFEDDTAGVIGFGPSQLTNFTGYTPFPKALCDAGVINSCQATFWLNSGNATAPSVVILGDPSGLLTSGLSSPPSAA